MISDAKLAGREGWLVSNKADSDCDNEADCLASAAKDWVDS